MEMPEHSSSGWSVDPRIAIVEVRSLADVVNAATAQPRLRTIIFVALASLALLLAAVGLSGVVAYSVSQRTREIGIRIALGASAQDVVRMVLSNATRLSVAGVVLGVVSAYGTTRILSSMVYGVTTHDPWSFAGACAVLLGIAFIASYAPARRAARVDPVISLKAE
jgi:putative ABC transport system permease protein